MIGYKIIVDLNDKSKRLLATLNIPEDAKTNCNRSCILDRQFAKYRCNKAFVVKIEDMGNDNAEVTSGVSGFWDKTLVYTVGEYVNVPDFDDNLDNQCTKGIHFFLDRTCAATYRLCCFKFCMNDQKYPQDGSLYVRFSSPQDVPKGLTGTVRSYYGDGSFMSELTVEDGIIVQLKHNHNCLLPEITVYLIDINGKIIQATDINGKIIQEKLMY